MSEKPPTTWDATRWAWHNEVLLLAMQHVARVHLQMADSKLQSESSVSVWSMLGPDWRRKQVPLQTLQQALLSSCGLFDRGFYLARNPDVGSERYDPLLHYLRHGGIEGRRPSPKFDGEAYLLAHDDVRDSGINPLLHYVQHGVMEGRKHGLVGKLPQPTPPDPVEGWVSTISNAFGTFSHMEVPSAFRALSSGEAEKVKFLEAQLRECHATLASGRAEAIESKTTLAAEISELQGKLNRLSEEQILRIQVEQRLAERDEYIRELSTRCEQLGVVSSQVDRLSGELDGVRAELALSKDAALTASIEHEERSAEVCALADRLLRQEAARAKAEQELASQEIYIGELQQKLDRFAADAVQSEKSYISAQVELRSESVRANKLAAKSKELAVLISSQAAMAAQKEKEIGLSLAEMVSKRSQMEQRLTEREARILDLESELKAAEMRAVQALGANSSLQAELASQASIIGNLQALNAELSIGAAVKSAEATERERDLERLRLEAKRLHQVRAEMEDLRVQLARVSRDAERANDFEAKLVATRAEVAVLAERERVSELDLERLARGNAEREELIQRIAQLEIDHERALGLARADAVAWAERANAKNEEIQLMKSSAPSMSALSDELKNEIRSIATPDTLMIHLSDARDRIASRLEVLTSEIYDAQNVRKSRRGGGSERVKRLYLDLLEAALTGVLTEDRNMAPWGGGEFDLDRRHYGRDWPATATTMIGVARMRNLRRLVEAVLKDGVPGDLLEAGVWRGGACIYMRGILAAHGVTDRTVWVADSFAGLPPPDEELYPADRGDPHHTFAALAVGMDEVKRNFERFKLLDHQVEFLPGWFKDTLPGAQIERLAVLRLDGDMYGSTIETLEALYPRVSKGGAVIIDDYLLKPCQEAVHDYRERYGITDDIHDVDGAAAYWRKAL